jgi:hypothetical protein
MSTSEWVCANTVHPSTLEILYELGLEAKFDALPQHRVGQLEGMFAGGMHAIGDFRRLHPFPYMQQRRMLPAKIIQGIQVFIQRRIIAPALANPDTDKPIELSAMASLLLRSSFIRSLPTRIIGQGFRREHLRIHR